MRKMTRLLAMLLVMCLCLGMLASCKQPTSENSQPVGSSNPSNPVNSGDPEPEETWEPLTGVAGQYTYKDAVTTLASNWNPHVYQTAEDGYPLDFIASSLYTLIFNDANHPVEGKDPYDGFVIIPEMAAGMPVDVTAQVKASHPQFNIPASATTGYAWQVTLRDDLKWEDGTKITAKDFVESFKRLLDPKLQNYRAADYSTGSYAVVGAENYTYQGSTNWIALGMSYEDFLAEGGTDDQLYIDLANFWGITYEDGTTWGSILDETLIRDPAVEEGEDEDWVSPKYLWETYFAPGRPYAGYVERFVGTIKSYADGVDWDTVGLFASDDGTTLTFVYDHALDGFYLMTYGMSTTWLVKTDLYDANLKETETASGSVWSNTYATSVATTSSYGPYKMVSFQTDKAMRFEKNENWFGWTDGNHTYVDPEDGKTYDMYQTTAIDTQVVSEPATRKSMFLAGKLMGYGLQSEDFDQYRNSEYTHATPAETIFMLLFNGYESVINDREAADDFDQSTKDLQVQMLETFRRACAVSIDRELFAATVSPQRQGGYGFVGSTYIYDPETAAYYRDTDQAKMALINFYSIDLDDYNGDLDAAVNAITGYDPATGKVLFQKAYEEALELGYITDTNNDGKSDQTVTMVYAMSSEMSTFYEKTLKFINDSLNDGAKGTGFEGKILIEPSAPVGNAWGDNLRAGLMDTQLAGWSGSVLDPFSMTDTWTRTDSAYWGAWWDANAVPLTINIDGKDLTMSVRAWAECLNGKMKTVDGKDYNFGYGQTSVDNRLTILAAIEGAMLSSYNAVPIMQDGGMSLLSQQVYYVVEDYNPLMGRGGIAYMKYNYDDAQWADYVNGQPKHQLQY